MVEGWPFYPIWLWDERVWLTFDPTWPQGTRICDAAVSPEAIDEEIAEVCEDIAISVTLTDEIIAKVFEAHSRKDSL